MECPVCFEPYSGRVRKKITCLYCKKDICAKCFEQFILTTRVECALCFHKVELDFIRIHCPKTFLKKVFNKLAHEVIDEETLTVLETHRARVLTAAKIKRDSILRAHLHTHIRIYHQTCSTHDEICNTLYSLARSEWERCTTELEEAERTLEVLEAPDTDSASTSSSPTQSSSIFTCVVESCDGTVVNEKCIDCGTNVCTKCRMKKLDNHACDEDVLASLKFITADTKPCPTCKIPIHKISGCDQMFCTKCHVLFSWKTGDLQRAAHFRHNPHYLDWVRENRLRAPVQRLQQADPGDTFPCNVDRAIDDLMAAVVPPHASKYLQEVFRRFYIQRVIHEAREIGHVLRILAHNAANHTSQKEKIRKRYILKRSVSQESGTAERVWKRELTTFLKRVEMYKDLAGLVSTFEQIMADSLLEVWRDGVFQFDDATLSDLEKNIQGSETFMKNQLKHLQHSHNLSPRLSLTVPEGFQSAYHN